MSVKSPVVPTVKVRLAVPREVVTTSGPVLAPMGTVVVIVVALSVRMTAGRPLKVTVAPGSKLVPVIVTRVPMGPLAGSTVLIAGPTLTVKPRVTVASLPARSRAVALSPTAPSATVVVSQGALALTVGAGGVGASGAVRGWDPALTVSAAIPLPPSVASAWITTLWRTWASAGGARKSRLGATSSCFTVTSTAAEVRPMPPRAVANTSRVLAAARARGAGQR